MIKKQKGFTLIELLVVISVIGILASIVIVSFTSAQKQAKDTQRKSDLKQYQTAVESLANNQNGLFPARANAEASTLCSVLGLSNCPTDPVGTGSYSYYYDGGPITASCTGTMNDCATQYTLRAQLESKSGIWVYCSTGISGEVSSSTSFSNGGCPLGSAGLPPSAPPSGTCNDTDGGKEYYWQGTLSGCGGGTGPVTDTCTDQTTLIEGFCNAENNCEWESYECPDFCLMFACSS